MQNADAADCDYVVIGSGAGGGTVAARLAEAGMRVVLLEAGGDPLATPDPTLNDAYDVPAFHSLASEHPAMRWDYFVRHYADPARQRRDPKAGPEGVLYPRAGTLGGCTAHNAMIFVAPHDSDWDAIAELTGDRSWRAASMRRYFQAVENCRYHPLWRLLQPLRHRPDRAWLEWLARHRMRPAARRARRRRTGAAGVALGAGRDAGEREPAARRLGVAPRRGRSERTAWRRGGRRGLLHAALDRRAQPAQRTRADHRHRHPPPRAAAHRTARARDPRGARRRTAAPPASNI